MGQAAPCGGNYLTGVTSISESDGGGCFVFALKANGTLVAWGDDSVGQLGVGGGAATRVSPTQVSAATGLTTVRAVNASGWSSTAVATDGTVWVWGNNYNGQLGNDTTCGPSVCLGANQPTKVTGISGAVDVSSDSHVLVVTSDGSVWTWGPNNVDQLGNGAGANVLHPQKVTGISTAVAGIAGWDGQSVVLLRDGTALAWGGNDWCGLAIGSCTNPIASPTAVKNIKTARKLVGEQLTTLFLTRSGNG